MNKILGLNGQPLKKNKVLQYSDKGPKEEWNVHVMNLFRIIANNPGNDKLGKALHVFGMLLFDIGIRAGELKDPILNDIMCRLMIYTVADPESINYKPGEVEKIHEGAKLYRESLKKKDEPPSDKV